VKLEKVKITTLKLDPENARKHSERNIAAIQGSLEKFEQQRPLVVWNNTVIAGNGTLQAAKDLGWAEIQISRVPDEWDYSEARAYAIADNRTSELAEWDGESLLMALQDLPVELLNATGFDDVDLDGLIKVFGEPPSLDDLMDEFGEPELEDGFINVSFKIPPDTHQKWMLALGATGLKDMEAVVLVIQAAFDSLTDGGI